MNNVVETPSVKSLIQQYEALSQSADNQNPSRITKAESTQATLSTAQASSPLAPPAHSNSGGFAPTAPPLPGTAKQTPPPPPPMMGAKAQAPGNMPPPPPMMSANAHQKAVKAEAMNTKITAEDAIAIKKYIGSDYRLFNGLLRGAEASVFTNKDGSVDAIKLQKVFENLGGFVGLRDTTLEIVSALQKLPAKENDFVTRGVSDRVLGEIKACLETGKPYSDSAFMSTTQGANEWGGKVLMVIDAKTASNHGGRDISQDFGGFSNENECLFLPNAPMKVKSIETFDPSNVEHRQYVSEHLSDEKLAGFTEIVMMEAMDMPTVSEQKQQLTAQLNQQIQGWETKATDTILKMVENGEGITASKVYSESLQTQINAREIVNFDNMLKRGEISQEEHDAIVRHLQIG